MARLRSQPLQTLRQDSLISRGGRKSQSEGKGFEGIFKTIAQIEGIRIKKIPEFGRWIGPIAFKPIAGWVDFMLINHDGRVAFIDTKTIDAGAFQYSLIDRNQLDFLSSVGDLCPAGYVVCYRSTIQRVVYYKWNVLMSIQPGSSLKPYDGIDLGPLFQFSAKKIFLA